MPPDIDSPSLTLGIVGSGVMGRGIAQIAAQAGIRVLLHDNREGAAQEARASLDAQFAKLVEKGRFTAAQHTEAMARLEISALEAFAACDVVIEAIVENMAVKRELFQKLESIVREDCLIASNTSSLQVTTIAAACKRDARREEGRK